MNKMSVCVSFFVEYIDNYENRKEVYNSLYFYNRLISDIHKTIKLICEIFDLNVILAK